MHTAPSVQHQAMIMAARGCLGTPFHHQGRLPGVGLDCIGLVVIALRAAGVMVRDRQDYDRLPHGQALRLALLAHGAVSLPQRDFLPGDVLLFALAGAPQHVALCSAMGQMIHAYAPAGRVVESGLGAVWLRRLVGVYRFGAV